MVGSSASATDVEPLRPRFSYSIDMRSPGDLALRISVSPLAFVMARPSIESHAMAVGDFIDHMRFRQLDLLGYEGGSFIAAALAAARPDRVRRVVMVAAPGFDAAGDLPVVQQPVLMLRPQDGLRELTPRARELLPNATFVDLPGQGSSLLGAAPEDKAYKVYPGAHSVPRNERTKELLAWLDRYLGKVE